MATSLPSLNALRAFEAVGRLGSFTRAAEELNVTQAAVSHQVRVLEAQLGTKLLRRTTRRLELTAAGAKLLPPASSAFTQLIAAVAELRRGDRQIAVTTTAGFGARWLAPRLGRFAARYPDLEVTVRHTDESLNLEREGLDAAIRWGRGHWPGLMSELVAPAPLLPMASPAYVASHSLAQPEGLKTATLLHDEDTSEWRELFLMVGLKPEQADRGLTFDDENALVQAALDGQGVALLSRGLVLDALAEGALVQPLCEALAEENGYYLAYHTARRGEPKFEAFRAFLLEEGRRR